VLKVWVDGLQDKKTTKNEGGAGHALGWVGIAMLRGVAICLKR
jgi:hypothetical protein